MFTVLQSCKCCIFILQGDLLCVQSDCGLLALDFDFACKPVESLISFSKQEIPPTGLSAVGQSSTLWSVESKVSCYHVPFIFIVKFPPFLCSQEKK